MKEREYFLDGRIAICVITIGTEKIAICGVHFWCKLNNSFNQEYNLSSLRNNVYKICDKYKNVIFIGDFNLKPWENYMYSHLGFNALPWIKDVKQKGFLMKKQNKHYYLFNPMWSFLGGVSTCGAQGSYRLEKEGELEWQFIDQIICSKEMIDKIYPNKINVVSEVLINGIATDIMTKHAVGSKLKYKYSDHYPIFCNLN